MLSQVIVRVRPLNDRETFLGKQSLTKVPRAISYLSSISKACVACTVDYTPVNVTVTGGGMCIQQVPSNTIKVLSAPDTPHFTFDAVVDMLVQQEGVFAGMSPLLSCNCCQQGLFNQSADHIPT